MLLCSVVYSIFASFPDSSYKFMFFFSRPSINFPSPSLTSVYDMAAFDLNGKWKRLTLSLLFFLCWMDGTDKSFDSELSSGKVAVNLD